MTLQQATLDTANVGDVLTIQAITDDQAAMNAMRLGISVGETVTLASKIPGGPVVLRRGSVELALGREICRQIVVERVKAGSR